MANLTNIHNLPEIVVDTLQTNHYNSGDSDATVTQLIDSPRVKVLQRRHDQDMESDVSELIFSTLGTAMHNLFEEAAEQKGEDIVSEERLFVDIEGWKVSGAIDLQQIEEDGVIVSDYKMTSAWSVIFDKADWHKQLNSYAWLVRHAKGMKVKELRIIAALRDWQRRKASMEENYPNSPITVVTIPLWSDQEQDDWMLERVTLHQKAIFEDMTDGVIPVCQPSERWQKNTKFAVMKKSRVRAIKLHAAEDDANEHADSLGKDHYVDTRVGECTRCAQDWCGVARWCDQYQNELTGTSA
tara:strand:+ start:1850 stop:2743 length:894 start_codon:yes stop_codon:yes gene_type:complete